MTYQIDTTTTLPQYHAQSFSVRRRYRDFLWIHQSLGNEFPQIIIPPLPEKKPLADNFNVEFVEQRRVMLRQFLRCVASIPALHASRDLQLFLESEDESELGTRRSKTEDLVGAMSGFGGFLSKQMTLFRSDGDEMAERGDAFLEELNSVIVRCVAASDDVNNAQQSQAVAYQELRNAVTLLCDVHLRRTMRESLFAISTNLLSVSDAMLDTVTSTQMSLMLQLNDMRLHVLSARHFIHNRTLLRARKDKATKNLESAEKNLLKTTAKATVSADPKVQKKKEAAEDKRNLCRETLDSASKALDAVVGSTQSEMERFDGLLVKQMLGSFQEWLTAQVTYHENAARSFKKALTVVSARFEVEQVDGGAGAGVGGDA